MCACVCLRVCVFCGRPPHMLAGSSRAGSTQPLTFLSSRQINPRFAKNLVNEVPPIEVDSRIVSCDGGEQEPASHGHQLLLIASTLPPPPLSSPRSQPIGNGALGHPKVYINLVSHGLCFLFRFQIFLVSADVNISLNPPATPSISAGQGRAQGVRLLRPTLCQEGTPLVQLSDCNLIVADAGLNYETNDCVYGAHQYRSIYVLVASEHCGAHALRLTTPPTPTTCVLP